MNAARKIYVLPQRATASFKTVVPLSFYLERARFCAYKSAGPAIHGPTPIDTALDTVRFTRRGASDCRYHGVDARIDEAEVELARAKEINPTGSDLIFEIEGTLQFW